MELRRLSCTGAILLISLMGIVSMVFENGADNLIVFHKELTSMSMPAFSPLNNATPVNQKAFEENEIDYYDDDNYETDGENDDYTESKQNSVFSTASGTKSTLTDSERAKDGREDDVLSQLLKLIGDEGPFPIIVGGIGDSGTRGVRAMLQAFQVQMLGSRFVNGQGDSQIFQSDFPVFDPVSKSWSNRNARTLYKLGMHRARTVQYNQSHFNPTTWEYGRQFVGAMLWRSRNVSALLRSNHTGRIFDLWGMKHPRSILILPYLAAALGEKIRFVHVLRDGKEVVSGVNQQMFIEECRRYYGRQKCSRSFEKKFEFWTDVNWDVYKIAQKLLSKKSYMMVRIEDFVAGDVGCTERLARFVGIPEMRMKTHMKHALNLTVGHNSSYFGHQRSKAEKNQTYIAIKEAPTRISTFMDMIGYSKTSFKLTKSCFDLPSPN